MLKTPQGVQSFQDNVMAGATMQVGNKRDTAGIVLETRVIKTLRHRKITQRDSKASRRFDRRLGTVVL